ncbi:NAD(P)H dehydrogenase (quinone) [Arcanobacterium wilhelmae]|uniref:NAD(P)H dehydrogenase (Quinone) n=1 Tax=Arcanobacterium wilhelmae TaxID=1803177 RepID=A0ABT9ND38_9ACTO|nr:NAD(P)H-binding protein [Arcanobacterium wilhelmae]MDP9801286.1 NAD(P)H dehydrogenase (quinone) [Arcanobacterium wilhelmae]WFN90631.1 NAD(P)H-binding protein [Arcanobacterium wilhelmae]
MTIAVTGATGHLGSLILTNLAAAEHEEPLIALARDTDKAAGYADQAIEVRHLDYTDPQTFPAALDGVSTLVFVSSNQLGNRAEEARNLINAAENAGVTRLVYTSFVGAQDHPDNPLTPEHKATEDLLATSSLAEVIVLRNGYYYENLLSGLNTALETGKLIGALNGAKIAGAARADLAEAAAKAARAQVTPGTYDLVGEPLSYSEIAAQISQATGIAIEAVNVTPEEYKDNLVSAGMPDAVAQFYTDVEVSGANGSLESNATDLYDILGHELITVADVVRAARK